MSREISVNEALTLAINAHKTGNIQEADKYYTAILNVQPYHPDANHNLGVLAVGIGKAQEALPYLQAAIKSNPNVDQFWISYINTLIKLDRIVDAKKAFEEAKSKGCEGDLLVQLEKSFFKEMQAATALPENKLLESAKELRDSGKLAQAINLLLDAIKKFPKESNLLALLSHCLILQGKIKDAAVRLEEAKKIDPNTALVSWNEVRLLLKEQSLGKAIKIAREANDRFPDDVEGLTVLGSCLRINGEMDESLKITTKAISLDPQHAEAYITRGLIWLSKDEKLKAEADLDNAHRIKPHLTDIWDLLVDLKIAHNKFKETIELIKTFIEINPTISANFEKMAFCHLKLSEFDEAITAYKKVIDINPQNPDAYINLGLLFERLEKFSEALETYDSLIARKPTNIPALNNKGNVLQKLGNFAAAVTTYKILLRLEPSHLSAYLNMGLAENKLGNFADAVNAYRHAISLKPNELVAHYNLGVNLAAMEQLEQAVHAYNDVISLDPSYNKVYYNLANVQRRMGMLAAAVESYNHTISIEPEFSEAYMNLGATYLGQGQLDLAIKNYQKAAVNPNFAEAFWNHRE